VTLLFAFAASVVLAGVGGVVFPAAHKQFRAAGVALIGLGVLLLALALISAANFNA